MAVDIIDRSKLSGLIPEPVTREIIQGAVTESAVLRMARRLPNMTSKTQTLNVLDALPTAYFVNGEATTGASDSKASLKKNHEYGVGQEENLRRGDRCYRAYPRGRVG